MTDDTEAQAAVIRAKIPNRGYAISGRSIDSDQCEMAGMQIELTA